MNPTAKSILALALAATAFVVFLFGEGVAPWAEASAAVTGSTRVGEIRWMWLPASVAIVIGLALFLVGFRKK